MEQVRTPLQGVTNIIRFNWHFYFLSIISMAVLGLLNYYLPSQLQVYAVILLFSAFATTVISLLVSYYVYDFSNLYRLDWLENDSNSIKILNINAGFDETSELLQLKFKNASLVIMDFYNPETHTEVSIKRARKAYPPSSNTLKTSTSILNLADNSVDKVFITLSAHEIRNENERVVFFKEVARILKPKGQIFVTEHLRDTVNFLAYNIGFFHFLSKSSWHQTFQSSNLSIRKEVKITPFITTFILETDDFTN